MNILEEVPLQTILGSLEEPLGGVELVMAPDITIPDYLQILRDTKYEFTLEKWVLTGLQGAFHREEQHVYQAQKCGSSPSCPPYALMFSGPQESCWANLGSPIARPRSHSDSSADTRGRHRRTVRFLIADSEDEAGYSEDNEGSSTDDVSHRPKSRERPRTAASKDPISRVKDLPHSPSPRQCKPASPWSLGAHKTSSTFKDARPLSAQERSPVTSPVPQRPCKKLQRSKSSSRKYSLTSQPSRLQPPRPSSAGPIIRYHRQKGTMRTSSSHGMFLDSSAELLSALSKEERELVEAITDKGYSVRTAIMALQKTGYCHPDMILRFLGARYRLCKLGYDEAQVEEALEMYQNCERKAAEFLCLLAQFNEMGFQQSAIKEVLLIHENHRERALEELMTRTA